VCSKFAQHTVDRQDQPGHRLTGWNCQHLPLSPGHKPLKIRVNAESQRTLYSEDPEWSIVLCFFLSPGLPIGLKGLRSPGPPKQRGPQSQEKNFSPIFLSRWQESKITFAHQWVRPGWVRCRWCASSREVMHSVDFDDVINDFVAEKSRRRDFWTLLWSQPFPSLSLEVDPVKSSKRVWGVL